MKKKIICNLLCAILFCSYNLNSATYTVTTLADNVTGSLRERINTASSGDTIIFNSGISAVYLTGSDIAITKNLTINGHSTNNKVTINAGTRRIFSLSSNYNFTINNLILTGANHTSNGGAMIVDSGTFNANNCIFKNNTAGTNGGVMCVHSGRFIANNCAFLNNSAGNHGTLHILGFLFATNCTFSKNSAYSGGAIHSAAASTFLYHCTIDSNSGYGLVGAYLRSYNCVYTGNTPDQISGSIAGGDNLIQGQNGLTRNLVFGTNKLTSGGYIIPKNYVKTANKLFESDIVTTSGITTSDIINKLKTDQIGKLRHDCIVTYGSVEADTVIPYIVTFNLTVNATTGGTTNPTGTTALAFDCDTTLTLIATPNTCYHFVNWKNSNGNIVSTNNPLTVTIRSDTTLIANFIRDSFNLTLIADPSNCIVSGPNKIGCGDSAIISAIPDSCYNFLHWKNTAGKILFFKQNDTIKLASDSTLIAIFKSYDFDIFLHTNPLNAGITYNEFNGCDTAIISAIPGSCYNFLHWTDAAGNILPFKQNDTITLTSDSTLIAVFESYSYNIFLTVEPQNSAEVYNHFRKCDTVGISAKDNVCYEFVCWIDAITGDTISFNRIDTIILEKQTSLIAVFERNTSIYNLDLSVKPENVGIVSGEGVYNCKNSIVNITANSIVDCYVFKHWEDTAGNIIFYNQNDTITVMSDSVLIAVFEKYSFNILAISQPSWAGNIIGAGKYICKDTATLIATTRDSCYQFLHWQKDLSGAEKTYDSVINIFVTNNETYIAYFDLVEPIKLQLKTEPANAKVILSWVETHSKKCNPVVPIQAYINDKCTKFKYWSNEEGDIISTENHYDVHLISDSILVAHFDTNGINIQLNPSPTGAGLVNNKTFFDTTICDSMIIIKATANDNYYFYRWTDALTGEIISLNPIDTIIISSDIELIAEFITEPPVSITLTTDPFGSGKTTGAGNYKKGAEVTITAIITNDCYTFRRWKDINGNLISTQPEYIFIADSNTILVAEFLVKEFAVTIYSSPTYMGSISGATTGLYDCGKELNLKAASSDTVYSFAYWSDEFGNVLETSLEISVTIKNNITLIANFVLGILEDDIYDISIVPNPAENDFNIIFNSPDEQRISVYLLDISGATVLDIFEGIASQGEQIYHIDKELSSGTYFIKFIINGKSALRKVIVK
ncbi:MAG: T9SS type A sorting domain-containing protein [Bacteroidetes bacterium]|nr:T9SS type A sorting domain-containing protein [Bacteroidota bacterium]